MAGAPWREWRSGHRRQAFDDDMSTPSGRLAATGRLQANAELSGGGRVPRLAFAASAPVASRRQMRAERGRTNDGQHHGRPEPLARKAWEVR
jgi:hypothetical protein